MKICPICDATYDEEVIRFCTKDGTPLIEDSEPSFVELPSEELEEPEDDIGEITVIRRKDVPAPPPPIDEPAPADNSRLSERIVIPTNEPPPVQNVRPRPAQVYYPPIEKPNTVKVVALTVFGTVVLLGLGAWLFWMLSPAPPANSNVNINTNLGAFNGNLNSNSNVDSNFNFNMNSNFPNINGNFNTNINANANVKTPTPTPKPSPSVTPTPDETPDATPTRTPPANANTRPTPSPTPRMGPRPTAIPTRSPE